jgi:S-adenosylmethionine synthetase
MTGEDIKVFSVRRGSEINMTVAVAFVAHLVKSIEEYISYKNVVALDLQGFAEKLLGDGEGERIDVAVNTGDSHENREVYLTKTGLSCEAGDDGQVGRGNRVNGLITPSRPMTLEAAAGKNPATHTGKLYSVIANEIAIDVVKLYPQVRECGVQIASQIGRKLDDPYNLSVSVIMKKGEKLDPIKGKIHDIAEDMITNVNWVSRQLAEGRYSVF